MLHVGTALLCLTKSQRCMRRRSMHAVGPAHQRLCLTGCEQNTICQTCHTLYDSDSVEQKAPCLQDCCVLCRYCLPLEL